MPPLFVLRDQRPLCIPVYSSCSVLDTSFLYAPQVEIRGHVAKDLLVRILHMILLSQHDDPRDAFFFLVNILVML